jgi:AraC-like DNA-binding protein
MAMQYLEYLPHPRLLPYIHAYWMVEGDENMAQSEKILPDGCVDIIYNIGADFHTDRTIMKYQQVFIVGTMTHCKEPVMHPGTRLFGIRFKPAAFAAFFEYASLKEITDISVDFEKKMAPPMEKIIKHGLPWLNQYFLDKLTTPKHTLFPVIADIQQQHGLIPVETLAKKHFITTRQLERQFNQYLGVSPKEFTSFVRYQYTYDRIRNNYSNQSLHDIAIDCGYYDHAHLTNEIKKYTGLPPSQIWFCRIFPNDSTDAEINFGNT